MDSIVDTLKNIDIMGKSKIIELKISFTLEMKTYYVVQTEVSLPFRIYNYNAVGISNFPTPLSSWIWSLCFSDNPLVCDCSLRWYRDWLKNLRNKDDEMMQKKRTICTMVGEHREYKVQELPIDRMNCVGKNLEQTSSNEGTAPSGFLTVAVATALAALVVPTFCNGYHCM